MSAKVNCANAKVGTFTWKVPQDKIKYCQWLQSDKFTIGRIPGTLFSINIQLAKDTTQKRIDLLVIRHGGKSIEARIKIRFLCSTSLDFPARIQNLHTWEETCYFKHLLLPTYDWDSIKCTITLDDLDVLSIPPLAPKEYHNVEFSILPVADCKIIIGTEMILAHRLILAAHSYVFYAKFKIDLKNQKESKITIKNATVDVVKNILSFLYDGLHEPFNHSAVALSALRVASVYNLMNLKTLCEYKLSNNLTKSNVVHILDQADIYQAKNLKKNCLSFIIKNKKNIVKQQHFEVLCYTKPHLMVKFIQKDLPNAPDIISCTQPQCSTWHSHVGCFLFEAALSDVKLVIGDTEIHAHKLMLCLYSPVFKSMFEIDMKEKKESRVVIKDIHIDVMKVILTFMYTQRDVLNDVEMIMSVLAVTEMYDMKTLKDLCEVKLSKKLTVSNVTEIIDSADTHNAKYLRDECLQFIVQNREHIVHAEMFETLCHKKPHLPIQLMRKIVNKPI